ncbi:MAG: LPS-assembly protein LptD, partial [Proteobacteria bacterium]|nr:LPS-assembly protein LptD [Pseudomonadota bacterium]
MLVRLYLVYFLSLFASTSFASEVDWNCQQDKNTKEWVCVGSAAAANPISSATPKIIAPKITETAEKAQTFDTKPLQAIKPVEAQVQEKVVAQAPAPISNPISAKPKPSPIISEELPRALPATQKPVSASSKPVAVDNIKPRGWNCDAKGEEGKWNCQLEGADPKGEARVVDVEEHSRLSLLGPAFDYKEENIFNTLRGSFKNNPWGNCSIQLGTQKYYVPDKKQRDNANFDTDSDAAEIYDNNEVVNYQGNVKMKRADQQSSSNSANYDSISENLDLHGNVFYSEDELSLFTDTATLKLASDEARLRDTLFISSTTPIRGKASVVYRDSKTLSRYKNASYTSCEPGNQDWIAHATDLKMNKKTGRGSAKNVWIELKGVPVFYSPYLSFPIDDRRKSGFLAPSYERTQLGGLGFIAPFYWNIAPNYDATIRPRYYSERGSLLAG